MLRSSDESFSFSARELRSDVGFIIQFFFDFSKPPTREHWSEPRRPRLKSHTKQIIAFSIVVHKKVIFKIVFNCEDQKWFSKLVLKIGFQGLSFRRNAAGR